MPLNINEDMPIGRPPSGKVVPKAPAAPSGPSNLYANGRPPLQGPDVLATRPTAEPTAPGARTSKSRASMPTPDVLASGARAAMPAPDVLASKPAGALLPPFPLTHARFLWDNKLLQGSTLSSDPAATNISGMINPATYSKATFSGPSVIMAVFTVQRTFDSIGIGAHTLAGSSILIEFRPTDSAAWEVFYSGVVPSGALFRCVSSSLLVKEVRITTSKTGTSAIGSLYIGSAVQMQRPIFRGVEPPILNRATDFTNNVSEGGQWLGRDIVRQGLKFKASWAKLTSQWVRDYFDPFASAARRTPFFYSWNPQDYPNDAAYCWTTSDIKFTVTGPLDYMSVDVEMEGHG